MGMINSVSSMLRNEEAEEMAFEQLSTLDEIVMEQDDAIDATVDGIHEEDDTEVSDTDVDEDDDVFGVSDNHSSANPDFNFSDEFLFEESELENTYGKKPGFQGSSPASPLTGHTKAKTGSYTNKPGYNGSASPATAVSKDLIFEEADIENVNGRQPGQDGSSAMESLVDDIEKLLSEIDDLEKTDHKPGYNGKANFDTNFSAENSFDESEAEKTAGKKPGTDGSAYVSMESAIQDLDELTAAIESMTASLEADLDASDAIAASSGAGSLDTSTTSDEDEDFDDLLDDEDDLDWDDNDDEDDVFDED